MSAVAGQACDMLDNLTVPSQAIPEVVLGTEYSDAGGRGVDRRDPRRRAGARQAVERCPAGAFTSRSVRAAAALRLRAFGSVLQSGGDHPVLSVG